MVEAVEEAMGRCSFGGKAVDLGECARDTPNDLLLFFKRRNRQCNVTEALETYLLLSYPSSDFRQLCLHHI